MTNSDYCEAEDRSRKREDQTADDGKQCDLRAVVDAYREGLCDMNEARALMGLGQREDDMDEDRDDMEEDEA